MDIEIGFRLKYIAGRHGMKCKDLATSMGYTPEHLSQIMSGKRHLTKEAADKVIRLFPEVRLQWLLCQDNFMTEEERLEHLEEVREHKKRIRAELRISVIDLIDIYSKRELSQTEIDEIVKFINTYIKTLCAEMEDDVFG